VAGRADELRDRIEQELAPALAPLGLDVEAVEITPAGKRRILRVAVDGDQGVTLDHVAEATRVVSDTLDAGDVMGEQPYTLEVTSRGVDRPLTLPRHWRRNADRLVAVQLADGTSVTGRVVGSDDRAATLLVESDGTRREVAYGEVTRALVQIEFNRKGREADDDDVNDATDDVDDDADDDATDDATDDVDDEGEES